MDTQFIRTERVVRVQNSDNGLFLESQMGNVELQNVENIECFRSQLKTGDFIKLERRAPETFKILGIIQAGSVLHEVYELAAKQNLEFGFSEAIEAEVAQLTDVEMDFSDCEDFSHIPFVTVDGAGTKDLDQALYVGTPDDGFYQPHNDCVYVVWYAIADASWFVRPGSALFEEALKRGTSIYFADMSVPMLPRALSQGIISLNADVDRRALVFIMQVAANGVCLKTELRRGKIHSRAKLANEDVSVFLKDPQNHAWAKTDYAQSLIHFKDVGLIRMAESRTRNVVHFNRVALDVGLNYHKTDYELGVDARAEVDLYNEQLSLLCNMEGAKILNHLAQDDPEVLAIFRNHEAPSEHALAELHIEMNALAKAQNMPEGWLWNPETTSLADFFEALPRESLTCDETCGTDHQRMWRVRQAMERLVLMMQRRSVLSPDAGLHSALGVNPYARFSAPMREIVGIFTHKEAIEAEFDVESPLSRDENAQLRTQVIQAATKAKSVQRNIDKAVDSCAIAHIISHDYDVEPEKRPLRRGTILGMKSSAIYVRLDMPPIELKVYIKDIAEATGQNWTLNDDKTILTSADGNIRYVVGDSIDLRVSSFEPVKKKWRVIPIIP